MIWISVSVLVLVVVLEQSITQNTRSFTMLIRNDRQFPCVTTTCLPDATIIVSHIHDCRIKCLARTHCEAASFYQSNLTCQLFDNISSSNMTLEAATGTVTMIVVSSTRILAGESERAISPDNQRLKYTFANAPTVKVID